MACTARIPDEANSASKYKFASFLYTGRRGRLHRSHQRPYRPWRLASLSQSVQRLRSSAKWLPSFNQSPFVTQTQVQAAYGKRWTQLSAAVRGADPGGRMLNPYFAALLTPATPSSQ